MAASQSMRAGHHKEGESREGRTTTDKTKSALGCDRGSWGIVGPPLQDKEGARHC